METILVVVTGLSLAIAVGMGAVLVRQLGEQRRRSDARVALLEQLAGTTGPGSARAAVTHRSPAPGTGRAPLSNTVHEEAELELRPASATPASSPQIFHQHEEPAAWPRRFAAVGVMTTLLAMVLLGWGAIRPAPSPTPGNATPAAATADQPLELLSLQHAQEASALVISGLVQNPRSAAARSGIHATVQLFGPGGEPLTSGRAPLDFRTLSPGDESPFVIRVPVSGPVARYRVGFRGENDRVLGHVDRRNPATLARKQVP